ncbi:hypothetical protein [Streptomyces sp. NPDC088766]|uniref:hypothetical protein n=1 Tax=Streptomyces sp. NPDC088766 TaxID=3365893 RepID=UPI0038042070
MDRTGELPDPERPLSQAGLWVWVNVPAGTTTADFTVVTAADQVAEPAESVRLALTDDEGEPLPGRPVRTGTVTDTP